MKPDLSVVSFLCDREMGQNQGKITVKEQKIPKSGNVCEQVLEERATIPTKNQACEFSGQTRSTFLMAFSPDGTKMASTHGDHAVRITDLASGKCIHTLKGHPRTPWCVAFHPVSNDILASGCLAGEVRIWDLRGGGSEVWRSEKNNSVTSMAFHPTDQVLVFAVANEVHFWDWTQPEPFATATTNYEYEKVRWVRFDPHGYHLYTGIGNGVSIQAEQPHASHINSGGGHHTIEERANLQNQYRRILDEINQLRRERLQNESSNGSATRRPQSLVSIAQRREASSSSGTEWSQTTPRPPSPVHVDALFSARMYAAALTHAQQSRDHPSTSSQSSDQQSQATSVNVTRSSTVPRLLSIGGRIIHTSTGSGQGSSAVTSLEGSAAAASETLTSTNGDGNTSGSSTVTDSATTEACGSSSTTTALNDSEPGNSEPAGSTTTSGSNDTVSSSNSAPGGSTSITGITRLRPQNSKLTTFLRSQLTSMADRTSSSLSSLTTSSTQPSMSTTSLSQSNTIQPVTVLSMAPSPNPTTTFAPVSFGRPNLTPSSSGSLSSQLASAFQAQSMASRTTSIGGASTTLSPSTSSESVRGRFMSYLSSRASASSVGNEDHYQCACQVCQNYPSLNSHSRWASGHRNVPIIPRRVSRSTNGREGPSYPRPRASCRRLAGLLESEVRQALDQVRARRSDISETLRDLDNLRQEIDTHHCPAPSSSNTQQSEQSRSQDGNSAAPSGTSTEQELVIDTDDDLPSSQESTGSLDALLALTEDPPRQADEPPNQGTASSDSIQSAADAADVLPGEIPDPVPVSDSHPSTPVTEENLDLDASSQGSSSSASSLGSMESLPSSQEDGTSQDSDATLAAIGNYSSEIERRVHELDQRISNIQNRLQLRLQSLQEQRERQHTQRIPLSSVPNCLSVSERIRQRHERLRTHLQELRRRYQNRIRNARDRQNGRDRDHRDRTARSADRCRRAERLRQIRREMERSHRSSAGITQNTGAVGTSTTTAPHSSRRNHSSSRLCSYRRHREHGQSSVQSIRSDMARSTREARERQRGWHSLQRLHLHPHYSVSILDETVNRPDDGLQAAINRAIAGAFIASGESGVASNIINTSFRIQRWEFSRGNIPEIKNSKENIIVPHCKLHNDAYCDISKDGRYLATFVPSHNGFPDDSILAVFSLVPETFKQCLFTKSFGPNFVSVSISPLNNYLLVGLATRRLAWVFTPRQMVAQVYKIKNPVAGEDSMEHVCDLMHPCDMDIRQPVSVNSARWLPYAGEGIVYGTNRGDLHICRPGFEQEEKRNDPDGHQDPGQMRPNWVMNMLGLNVPRTTSTSTQTIQRVRRTASTQTEQVESTDST